MELTVYYKERLGFGSGMIKLGDYKIVAYVTKNGRFEVYVRFYSKRLGILERILERKQIWRLIGSVYIKMNDFNEKIRVDVPEKLLKKIGYDTIYLRLRKY